MKAKKGEVDLITLVVGIVPMILFIILSAYILVENPVQTDLGTQINFEEARFESTMALSHVLVFNDTLERINNYSEFPDNPNNVESIIESDIYNSTTYLVNAYGIRDVVHNSEQDTDYNERNPFARRFMVNVTMPEEDNISVSTPNTYGAFLSAEANIASPKPDPITIEVVLDRG